MNPSKPLSNAGTRTTVLRTRIKICGLTREADLDAAVAAGADAIGFVLYPRARVMCHPSARWCWPAVCRHL